MTKERPVIISTYLPGSYTVSHNDCDGDCACATEVIAPLSPLNIENWHKDAAVAQELSSSHSQFSHPKTMAFSHTTQFVKSRTLYVEELNNEFSFLFDATGVGGVVVVDEAAYEIIQQFETPTSLLEVTEDWHPYIGQLIQLGVLVPLNVPQKTQIPESNTLITWLHVTNACNLRCPYCYLHKTQDDMEIEHGKQAIDAIFRSAVNQGFQRVKIKYAGGEATLKMANVVTLHQYGLEKAAQEQIELQGSILSNGVAFGAKTVAAIKELDLQVMISLDGIGAVHDAQRVFINQVGSFSHVERTLDLLAQEDVAPTISVTITNRNLHSLPETVQYLLDRDLQFTLNFYRENHCSESFVDLEYGEDAIIRAMNESFGVIEQNLPERSLLSAILDRASLASSHSRPCGVGQNYLVIDQNGGVAKCHMLIEETLTTISDPDPLLTLQNDIIHLQNPSVDDKLECSSCNWRYWCAGGCPVLTHRVTGRYDVKSPNCNIYQALFPRALRLEALRLLKYQNDVN